MTLAPLISCYQAMLPKALKVKQKREITKKYDTYYKIINTNCKLSSKQLEVVNLIKDKLVSEKDLVDINNISKARLNTLVEKNVLAKEIRESYRLEHNNLIEEKNKLTDSMVLFIVLNTASIQIIPTTVIAIRNSLGSQNPTKIIIPVWIATICAAVSGITLTKLLLKINRR